MRWACVHDKPRPFDEAPEPCGKVAFYSLVKPVSGMILRSQDFRKPDGAEIEALSKTVCGSCGKFLDMAFASLLLSVVEEQ